jgi:hypothetical protein
MIYLFFSDTAGDIFKFYLPADLPAFLLITSPAYFTPFPLYGSGLRKLLIFAAT